MKQTVSKGNLLTILFALVILFIGLVVIPFAYISAQSSGTCGCANCSAEDDELPTPTCSLSASPTSVPAAGGNVKFTWSSTNATAGSLYGASPASVGPSGTRTVFVKPKTQTLEVWNSQNGNTCQRTIGTAAAPNCTLSSNVSSVPAEGGNVTFTWTSSNTTGRSLWGGNPSSVPASGSQTIFVKPKTQTLQVWGPGGEKLCTKVIGTTPEPYSQSTYYSQSSYYSQSTYASYSQSTYAAPTAEVSIVIEPSLVRYNGSATISWDGDTATSCTVTGGTLPPTTGVTGEVEIENITAQTTYTLSCTQGSGTVNASTTVRVLPQPNEV